MSRVIPWVPVGERGPRPQLKGPHQSVGVHHLNSRGHAKLWESITPTQWASNMGERDVNWLS